MKEKIYFLILLVLISLISLNSSHLLRDPLKPYDLEKSNNDIKFLEDKKDNGEEEKYFAQRLDHFNQQDDSTFNQRYWINDKFIDRNNISATPLFIYVCGEWECSYPKENNYVVQLAVKFKALLVIHEHRYYGKSQPKPDWSTENLKWLNTDQALSDLAHFTKSMNIEFANVYGIPENRRWVFIGGSYPGALVSWFRGKFPHIALGSWSSSGVVNAIEDFHQFDEVVSYAFNKTENCRQKIHDLVDFVNTEFAEGRGGDIKKLWESENIPDDEFFWYYSDIIAESVQYGGRTDLCTKIFSFQSNYVEMNKYLYETKGKNDKVMYPSEILKDTTIVSSKNARQWTYQFCSQLGYFQTPSQTFPPLKNKILTIDFWNTYCKRIFSIDIKPNTQLWNERYGGNNPNITKVMYFNGNEDPWKLSSILKSDDLLVYTHEIICDNCAHCIDLKNSQEQAVLDAQKFGEETLSQWLSFEFIGESLGYKYGKLEKFVNSNLHDLVRKRNYIK